MPAEPTVVHLDEREWEGWAPDQVETRGNASWKTLLSADLTPTEALTFGVARIPPGGVLRPHRHAQPEIYFVLDGEGVATLNDGESRLREGQAVFFPGNAIHSVRCAGERELRVAYVFAADSAEAIEYVFPSETD